MSTRMYIRVIYVYAMFRECCRHITSTFLSDIRINVISILQENSRCSYLLISYFNVKECLFEIKWTMVSVTRTNVGTWHLSLHETDARWEKRSELKTRASEFLQTIQSADSPPYQLPNFPRVNACPLGSTYVCSTVYVIKCGRNAANGTVRARVLRTVAPFRIYDTFPIITRERHPQKIFVDAF